MSKEFMLYIRNEGDAKAALTADEHLAFIKQCEVYIGQLKANKKLIAAQPAAEDKHQINESKESRSGIQKFIF
jgi:hypothetical protein